MSPDGSTCYQEYPLVFRNDLRAGRVEEATHGYEEVDEYHVACIRRQWLFSPVVRGDRYIETEAIMQPRPCPYFIKYEPGYSPEEHKELKREARTRRVMLIASLVGAAIGAGAAVIAQVLWAVFS